MSRERQIEAASAVVLALATALTAWSTYQASLWGGEEARHWFEATAANARASALEAQAQQRRNFDAALFVEYASAFATGQDRLATFLYERFPPELRRAVDAWRATAPLTNPAAPRSPFEMPEYSVPAAAQAAAEATAGADARAAARTANDLSDQYVLLTVFFALVLFFSGISGKFEWQFIDVAALLTAIVVLLGAALRLGRLPIQ